MGIDIFRTDAILSRPIYRPFTMWPCFLRDIMDAMVPLRTADGGR